MLVVALVVLCGILFTIQFRWNALGLVEPGVFRTFQRDTESLIVGRLVQSRSGGILSHGGLPGAGVAHDLHSDWLTQEQVERQFETYLHGGRFETYATYKSQIGAQGMLLSLLDEALPFGPNFRLAVLKLLTAMASATALILLLLWFLTEFGPVATAFAAAAVLLNQSITLLADNLWWSLWAFYLPVLAVIGVLHSRASGAERFEMRLSAVVFFAVLVKCLFNGYEYITTTLVMMTVPFVYYAVRHSWSWSRLARVFVAAIVGATFAGGVSFGILALQVGSLQESGVTGWSHIVMSLAKRTRGDAGAFEGIVAASLKAKTLPVIGEYLRRSFLDVHHLFPNAGPLLSRLVLRFRYGYVIVLVLLSASWLSLGTSDVGGSDLQRRRRAMGFATFYSLSAPLSWLVIFKAHSYIHTSINVVVWQMPFTLMGFASIGLLLSERRSPGRKR